MNQLIDLAFFTMFSFVLYHSRDEAIVTIDPSATPIYPNTNDQGCLQAGLKEKA